jgi:hypothetical protein
MYYGDPVTVLGFVPGVTISYDQAPVNITLQINWNGIPDTVTLSTTSLVGNQVPPAWPGSTKGVYVYSYGGLNSASWGLYYGPTSSVEANLGINVPQSWGCGYGEWFWYTFYPNVGNWEAFNSCGQVSPQPTYDITAMFEYSTTQIWFNHVAFNVDFLQLHKDMSWCTAQTFNDQISIYNAGDTTASGLILSQTFPYTDKLVTSPDLSMTALVEEYDPYGNLVPGDVATVSITGLMYPSTWTLPSPFNTLAPGYTIVITLTGFVSDVSSGFTGSLVFEAILQANQIPAWKDPVAYAALVYPSTTKDALPVYSPYSVTLFDEGYCPLFCENILYEGFFGPIIQTYAEVWIWEPLAIYVCPAPVSMTLDPSPVPLIAGETHVTQADVALVRNMMLGLAPYNWQADCSGRGFINTQDLAEYEAAATS